MTDKPTASETPVANQFADKMAVVYRHLRSRYPWAESNDMPWEDEMICGIDGLFLALTAERARADGLAAELARFHRLECEAGDTLGGRLDEWERAEEAERRAGRAEGHLTKICDAARALLQKVAVNGSVDGNPEAMLLNNAVKLYSDWIIQRNQPEAQPKIERTTWG